ncbi:FIGNL1-interacting regulator of recombination and mitosis [Chanos chanos]|uniref:FIGNL1-interacting regulator of recombination and mitosis n=1 Tax=Chanos chanos TaxID=29144 RepID=A0A6J2V388_CHACN|nr:uncharacterized protein C1orf112 homolog [Chanos chanos]
MKSETISGWRVSKLVAISGAEHSAVFQSPQTITMSQATLLEEVVQWSPETCQRELKSVLPKLISLHRNTESWKEHIDVLRIVTDLFLPHLPLSEMEEECFSKVLPKAVRIFTNLLEEISKQVGGLSSQNTELHASLRNILQMMVRTLEALSGCVRHVCSVEEPVSLSAIRTLPACTLRILKETFRHCKESEVVYNGRLSLVGDLLQGMFKEAYSLQKNLMELLEKISLENNASEDEIADMVTVIHSLLDICSIISSLDIALHANTWKFIIKQSIKHQSLVEERIQHGDIVSSLCEDLLASLRSCLELAEQIKRVRLQETAHSPEYKLFQKTTKMCRFFANTLVHYIKEFKAFLAKQCSRFHQLYLQILSKFPPSLFVAAAPPALCEELSGAVLVPMDALLTQLLHLRAFAESVLAKHQHVSPETLLPQCLLLVNVISKLSSQPEEALQLWADGSQFPEDTPRLSVFEALLLSFRRCPVERAVPVRLPGVMLQGRAQGKVSLHQHVCVHLCACIAVLPPRHFPLLERSLLGAVLQSDTQTAVLATDVWCFLARYGTAELCLHHSLLCVHLIKSCPGESYQLSHLALLLRRLLFLMTPNHQMELVEHFPPSQEDHLCVWRHILLRSLSQDARQRVEGDVVGMATAAVEDWQRSGWRLDGLERVNRVLECLLMVMKGESLQTESTVSSLKVLTQLWSRMCASQVQTYPGIQRCVKVLLSMSAVLIKNMEPPVICQALVCLSGLQLHQCPDDLLLAALQFLASLGKVFFPSHIQCQVFPRLSSLFSALLAHESWLLHQHALEAFALFAELTNHEEVISQSLISEETKTKVVNFLSKLTAAQEADEARVSRLKSETAVLERHTDRLEQEEDPPADVSAPEPCSKRARQETSTEDECERHLQTAESALKALRTLVGSGNPPTPPQWVTVRLQNLQTLITQINTSKPVRP